jgi:hypothetical protein
VNWGDPRHPIWPIIRTGVVMAGACVMLSITATSFDSGELKAVGGVGVASVAFDLVKRMIAKEV